MAVFSGLRVYPFPTQICLFHFFLLNFWILSRPVGHGKEDHWRYTFRALNIKPRRPSSPPRPRSALCSAQCQAHLPRRCTSHPPCFLVAIFLRSSQRRWKLKAVPLPLKLLRPRILLCFLCYFPAPLFLVCLLKFKDPS